MFPNISWTKASLKTEPRWGKGPSWLPNLLLWAVAWCFPLWNNLLFLKCRSPSDEASHSLDPILDNEWGVGQSINLLSQLTEPMSIFHELSCLGQCCEFCQARVLQKHNAVVQNNQEIYFFCLESYYLDLLRVVISCWLKTLIACRPIEEILEHDSIAYDILYVLIHTHGEMS